MPISTCGCTGCTNITLVMLFWHSLIVRSVRFIGEEEDNLQSFLLSLHIVGVVAFIILL